MIYQVPAGLIDELNLTTVHGSRYRGSCKKRVPHLVIVLLMDGDHMMLDYLLTIALASDSGSPKRTTFLWTFFRLLCVKAADCNLPFENWNTHLINHRR
jgi:hypothetical protein